MLTVYKFVGDWGLPDLSPFVIKLETWLRMAAIPYVTAVGDPNKGPKNKLPYIDDNGALLPDSTQIIEHLQRTRGVDLDAWLEPRQRALATAVKSMLEEDHYFIIMYIRWCTEAGAAIYRPTLLRYCDEAKIPRSMQSGVIWLSGRNLRGQAHAQGTARHSEAEIMVKGQQHWTAISELLGDQPYFLGERPTSIDATIYSFLVSTIWTPFHNDIKTHATGRANLVAYAQRMKSAYWA